jgi:hypothetical protein
MTVTAHNNQHPNTDGDDARVRMRVGKTAPVVPIRPDLAPGSAHARAIPDNTPKVKSAKPSKVRNFASQHVGEAKESLASSWLGQDRPQNLETVAKQLKTGNPAALFRLTVYAIAYIACFAVDTNKRAAVTFTLLALSILTAWAISAFAH